MSSGRAPGVPPIRFAAAKDDSDGSGGAAQILFATVAACTALGATDLVII